MGQVSSAVEDECSIRENCDACSIAIARTYMSYQTYLNNLFASNFQKASEGMFDRLHDANLQLEQPQ